MRSMTKATNRKRRRATTLAMWRWSERGWLVLRWCWARLLLRLRSWQNSESGKYKRITMAARVRNRPLPGVELVDMRLEFQQTGHDQIFSRVLIAATQAALDRGEQAMILLNRRGYSFVAMCRSCGKKLECINCAISLTHHKPVDSEEGVASAGQRLECHYCGYRRTVPQRCPRVRQRTPLLPGSGVAARGRAASGNFSFGENRSHGSRHRSWPP